MILSDSFFLGQHNAGLFFFKATLFFKVITVKRSQLPLASNERRRAYSRL